MTKTIKVIKEYEITIPDDKIEQHLKDYKEVIDSNGKPEDLFTHIAWNLDLGGTFVEGIGRVLEDGYDSNSRDTKEYKATDINCKELEKYTEED